MTLQEAHNFLFEPLPYCGCGDPQTILEKIQACLEYADNWQAQGLEWRWVVERLFAGDTAAAYLVFYLLDDVDLIGHAASLHQPWLTETGKDFLHALREHGCAAVAEGHKNL